MPNREDVAREWFAGLESAIADADADSLKLIAKEAARFAADKLTRFLSEEEADDLVGGALELLGDEIDAARDMDEERAHRLKVILDALRPPNKDDVEGDLVDELSRRK